MAATEKAQCVRQAGNAAAATLPNSDPCAAFIFKVAHAKGFNNYILTTGSNNIALNGLELIPGMYVARISNGNTNDVTKIIVQ